MNIPNLLSIFRMILVPVFALVFFSGKPYAYPLAAGIFALAGITYVVDGKIARKFNQITMLGRVLDPLADKMMVFTALVCLTVDKMIPLWLTIVYFGKEALQGIGGLLLFRKIRDVPPSNRLGKAATVLFYAAIAAIILVPELPFAAKIILLTASFALVFAALVSYLIRGIKLTKAQKVKER